MQAIRAIYDGKAIKPLDPIKTREKADVLVIFPDTENDAARRIMAEKARTTLRGSGKSERLTERLIESRREDRLRERR
ncbi:MAG: DUF104 domain-containing protein [Nitrospirae bacterium]|nr:DUF104 domain-containing protein [Nitrospirota bacterium]